MVKKSKNKALLFYVCLSRLYLLNFVSRFFFSVNYIASSNNTKKWTNKFLFVNKCLIQMPDNLANQLIGRLLPEVWNFTNIKKLIAQCDKFSPPHNALGILIFYLSISGELNCIQTIYKPNFHVTFKNCPHIGKLKVKIKVNRSNFPKIKK